MFAYEIQQAHQAELQRRADEWRLAQQAKAARTAQRRAAGRRTGARSAVRTDQEAAESAPRGAVARLSSVAHSLRPHSAA